jgi:hypothetical protein
VAEKFSAAAPTQRLLSQTNAAGHANAEQQITSTILERASFRVIRP